MSVSTATQPAPQVGSRRIVDVLALLATLFVIQTGVVPFDFFEPIPAQRVGEWFSIRTDYYSLPDIVSNIFLYVPLGLLLHAVFCRGRRRTWVAFAGAVVCAGVLSFAVEWVQVYSPSRVSSLIDLVSNVLGATIGAAISVAAGWVIPKFVGAVLYEFQMRPQIAAIKAYCLMLLVFGTMPFSFSFDVGRIKESVKRANLIPFANATQPDADAAPPPAALTTRAQLAQAYNRWAVMKSWSRWAVELLSFAVLAWLFLPLLRDHYRFDGTALWGLMWWISGLMAIVLSGIQFFVVHRGFDATDIVFRLIGAALGLLTWSVWSRRQRPWDDERRANLWRKMARGAGAATLLYIVYTGIIPATFDAHADGPARSLASTNLLPFFAYFTTRVDLMMDDLLEKFAMYAVLGASLAAWHKRCTTLVPTSNMFRITSAAVLISCGIEAIQMFIPVRVTSLTDPIIAGVGSAVGVMMQNRAAMFLAFAWSHQMHGPSQVPDAEPSGRSITPDDVLATLAQPHPNAPTERVRKRRRRTRRD
ncbi:MAG: VanZ family protein [Phycisphaerae bacterium]